MTAHLNLQRQSALPPSTGLTNITEQELGRTNVNGVHPGVSRTPPACGLATGGLSVDMNDQPFPRPAERDQQPRAVPRRTTRANATGVEFFADSDGSGLAVDEWAQGRDRAGVGN